MIAPEAMKIVERANSYTEITPSGTGLRVIGLGSGAKVHTKQKVPGTGMSVESYRNCERYITVSSNPLPGYDIALVNIDAVMDEVVAELNGAKSNSIANWAEIYANEEQACGQCGEIGGDLRKSAYNNVWLHPECEEPFLKARMAENGIAWVAKVMISSRRMTAACPPS